MPNVHAPPSSVRSAALQPSKAMSGKVRTPAKDLTSSFSRAYSRSTPMRTPMRSAMPYRRARSEISMALLQFNQSTMG